MDVQIPFILLIEDSEPDAELAIEALAASGMANPVRHIADGDGALRFLQKAAADELPFLIVLDLNLGVLDGFDVLRTIRSMRKLAHLPVVVLTGSDDQCDREAARELGAISFMTKPLSGLKLFECVRSLGQPWGVLGRDPRAA